MVGKTHIFAQFGTDAWLGVEPGEAGNLSNLLVKGVAKFVIASEAPMTEQTRDTLFGRARTLFQREAVRLPANEYPMMFAVTLTPQDPDDHDERVVDLIKLDDPRALNERLNAVVFGQRGAATTCVAIALVDDDVVRTPSRRQVMKVAAKRAPNHRGWGMVPVTLADAATEPDEEATATALNADVPPVLHERYRQARENFAASHQLYRSDEIADLQHSDGINRALVASRAAKAGKIFWVERGGKRRYPAFQFDPVTGKPRPVVAEVLRRFPTDCDGWRIALWFSSANAYLEGATPASLLDNPSMHARIIAAAEAANRVELF
jgi:hypothetical protein